MVGAAMGRGLRIQQVKFLAWLEAYSLAWGDGDLGPGPWITADSRLARAHIEDPKPTKLNPVAGRESFLQAFEDRVHGRFRLVARQPGLGYYLVDDVLFNQCLYPEGVVGNCNGPATSSSYSVFPLWSSGFAELSAAICKYFVNKPSLP